jgi:hypothetical protein
MYTTYLNQIYHLHEHSTEENRILNLILAIPKCVDNYRVVQYCSSSTSVHTINYQHERVLNILTRWFCIQQKGLKMTILSRNM